MKSPIRPELTREEQLEEALANMLYIATNEALTEHRIWNGKEWKADLTYEKECLKLLKSKRHVRSIKKQIEAIENGYIGRVDVSPKHLTIIETASSKDGKPMTTIWFDRTKD